MSFLLKNKVVLLLATPIILYIVTFPFYYNNPSAPLFFNLYSLYQSAFEHHSINENFDTLVQNNRNYEKGDAAPDFVLPNIEGEEIALSDQRGNYVFLSFWASWCPICREENQHLSNLYDEYKDKDFEVIGVSLDRSQTNWEKAIDNDSAHWIQLSDLEGVDSEIATRYGVFVTPTTFLIDPEGNIVAKNLQGEELSIKLEEVFESTGD